MHQAPFIAFIFIIIALLGGITGLVFLILGLVMNNRRQWLPGAIVVGIAIIIGVIGIGFGVRTFVTKIKENNSHRKFQKQWDYTPSDSAYSSGTPVDTTSSGAISGFIEDRKNDLVYVKIIPGKNLAGLGITLEEVKKGMEEASVLKAICLVIKMSSTYTGKMKLTLFNEDNKEIGISEINTTIGAGKRVKFNFPFKDDVPLSETKYGTLTCN